MSNSSGWKSGDPLISTKRGRLRDAWSRGLRTQLQTLHESEQGKLLLFGEILLLWAETLPGRFLIAASALFGAWLLL